MGVKNVKKYSNCTSRKFEDQGFDDYVDFQIGGLKYRSLMSKLQANQCMWPYNRLLGVPYENTLTI